MPVERRIRTISLNDFIEKYSSSLALIENDEKLGTRRARLRYTSVMVPGLVESNSSASRWDVFPKVEYVGKVALPRECGHGKMMEQYKIHTKNISVQCMNDLIDMGWRRDGNNFYKTVDVCCNTYALRYNLKNFHLSRNHRKLMNHFADFLQYGAVPRSSDEVSIATTVSKSKHKKAKNQKTEDFTLESYIRRVYESCDAHKFETRLVRPGDKLFNETYEESFQLFKKYYAAVHKKDYDKSVFNGLIVDTPLKSFGHERHAQHFGTFNRQYLIDGKIVGVEMFDVLPSYLLAQASFYDPDLSHMNMGTFMILEHINFVMGLEKTLGRTLHYSTSLFNYCFKKHHYKLQYADEILTVDKKWVPLSKSILPLLEKEEKIFHSNAARPSPDICMVPCSYNGKILKFSTLQELLTADEYDKISDKLFEYVQEAGNVAKKMVVYV